MNSISTAPIESGQFDDADEVIVFQQEINREGQAYIDTVDPSTDDKLLDFSEDEDNDQRGEDEDDYFDDEYYDNRVEDEDWENAERGMLPRNSSRDASLPNVHS